MYIHDINPVFLSLGPLELRYYGLVYFLGFLLSWIYLKKSKLGKKIFKKEEHTDDFVFYLILGVLIFARLFYILFYNPQYYFTNPIEMIKFWHGGMSVHGGVFGGILGAYIFTRKYKEYKLLELGDIVSIPLAISLAFGRIANFINGELPGRIASVSWAVKFPNTEGFRHPSQLYESLKNLIIAFALALRSKKTYRTGELSALFLIMYSVLRFGIELLREPEIVLLHLTMGQILSIPLFILGIWIYKKI